MARSNPNDPFRPAAPRATIAASRLQIRRFQLEGEGCPTMSSVQVFLDDRSDRGDLIRDDTQSSNQMLSVEFPGLDNPRRAPAADTTADDNNFFQVLGPRTAAATCATQVQLELPAANGVIGQMNVQLSGASAGVRSINRVDRGQLRVRAQFRLNNATSDVRMFDLPNTPEARINDVQTDLGLSSRTADRQVTVLSVVQLQINGNNNDAALRLERLGLDLHVGDVAPAMRMPPARMPATPAPVRILPADPASGPERMPAGMPRGVGTPMRPAPRPAPLTRN